MFKALVSTLVLVSAAAAFSANAAVVTADQLTCSELLKECKETGRYYKATAKDGAIPIYDFQMYDENGRAMKNCGHRKVAQPEYVKTKDTNYCLVGYVCG